jgi:hypothetical protein
VGLTAVVSMVMVGLRHEVRGRPNMITTDNIGKEARVTYARGLLEVGVAPFAGMAGGSAMLKVRFVGLRSAEALSHD